MTPRHAPARRGITLTEILISILIMGVGLVSLATLFPLGLVRLREAARQSRSGLLAETAIADMDVKNLLSKTTFAQSYYGALDPFLSDAPFGGVPPINATNYTTSYTGGGLPVCYDPLWRAVTEVGPVNYSGNGTIAALFGGSTGATTAEARFGAGNVGGASNLRPNPSGGSASAYGLQRITNFLPWAALPGVQGWAFTYNRAVHPSTLRDLAVETFISPDDPVMQNADSNQAILNNPNPTGTAGSVVPEFFATGNGTEIRNDWKYTWFFTGQQADTGNGSVFVGDIVVCDGRPFGFDSILFPLAGSSQLVASGETTIEGVFGYSKALQFLNGGVGYGAAADRTVLLRWPSGMADPEIRVGSWFADVTYERIQATSDARTGSYTGPGPIYPMQRCHWYQVGKKGDVEVDPDFPSFRRLIVYTNTPVRSRTLLGAGGLPVHVNAALIMPSVINVFSTTIYTR